MKLSAYTNTNPYRFNTSAYSNSKKFAKVTQALMKPDHPYIQYEMVNKSNITTRDIYTAEEGDLIICLMNTKVRLIGIVDRLCVVPNTFCVLKPISISTNTLYALLKTAFIQKQLDLTKKSITIKDVKEIMFPYEISPMQDSVLNTLSKQFQKALISRTSFQNIIDTEFNDLKYALPIKLDDLVQIHEINKTQDNRNYGKKDLPFEEVMMQSHEENDNHATLLMPRKLKDINELRVGIICNDPEEIHVNQNLIKISTNNEILKEIELDIDDLDNLILAKYLAYYFLSSRGKAQLELSLESKNNESFKILKIRSLKQIQIPVALKMKDVVERIETQIHWHDAEKYSNQLDNSSDLFESFESIIKSLDAQNTTHYVSNKLFTTREFGILLAQYLVNNSHYNDLKISVVLESAILYGLFERHNQYEWDDTPIEFYSPHHEIEGDIIIVLYKSKQKLNLPENAKVIYIKER